MFNGSTLSGFQQNTRKVVKISEVILTDLKYNPAQYIYTSATVGGITTGGITKIGDNYSYSNKGSKRYSLRWKPDIGINKEIKTIVMASSDIIESAKKHPIVKKYVNGNKLVLENKPSSETIEQLNAVNKSGNTELFKQIATQNYIETLLTKDECEAVLDWMCNG